MSMLREVGGVLYGITRRGGRYKLGLVLEGTFFPAERMVCEKAYAEVRVREDFPVTQKYSNGIVWFNDCWTHPIEEMRMPAFAFYAPWQHYYQFGVSAGIDYSDPDVYDALVALVATRAG